MEIAAGQQALGFPRPLRRAVPWLAAIVVAFGLVADGAGAQDVRCDPRILEVRQQNDQGYRLRGDRCEGTYRQQVTTPALWVAAFHETIEDFSISDQGRVTLAWAAPPDLEGRISLQAQSVKLREFYRMDSQRPPGADVFEWSTSLLAARGLRLSDIGVRAYSVIPGGSLYLPLRIGQPGPPAEPGRYTLTLVPNVRLADVLVSVAAVEAVGVMPADDAYIRRNESLGRSIYPTQQPISVSVAGLSAPGFYLAEIVGFTSREDPLETLRIWFYHGG